MRRVSLTSRFLPVSIALAVAVAVAPAASPSQQADDVTVKGPTRDQEHGLDVYTITSPFTGRANRLDVLLPDKVEPGRKYPVLYVLPVGGEWAAKPPWGNGLAAVRRINAQNAYGLICVSMEFDTVPWYGSHATNPRIRHDQYLLKVIVPLIESRYPVGKAPADRLLIGFSKSGWGAVSLLLRHPDFFGAACSWDAPLMMKEDNLKYGSAEHFGTPAQAAPCAPANLVEKQAGQFAGKPVRLTILGYDNFGPHTESFHRLLESQAVPHRFDNSLRYKHAWESGWLAKALDLMLGSKPAK